MRRVRVAGGGQGSRDALRWMSAATNLKGGVIPVIKKMLTFCKQQLLDTSYVNSKATAMVSRESISP